jgi:hypothetical protein
MKLANAMDIRFSSDGEDGVFNSVMYVPIIPHIEYSDTEGEEERGGFIGWLRSIFEKSRTFFAKLLENVKSLGQKLFKSIKKLALKVVSFVKNIFTKKQ